MTPRRLVALLGTLLLMTTAACGNDDDGGAAPSPEDGIRIASFDFAESALLAEMYAQVIEAAGIPVVRLGAVGPREIVAPALELDRIDLVPEYLGTALQRAGSPAPNPDTEAALADLDDRLDELGLTALAAAPAQDRNVVVVSADFAARTGVELISDLAALAPELRFGGPAECPDRPLCLIGLEQVYGLHFADFVAQRSQRFTAEALRRGEIDVALMFSTASALATPDLVVLDDDRRLQPAENVVPVMRTDALARWGDDAAAALDALSAQLTTLELRLLNVRVDNEEAVEQVAREWLTANGLLATG